MGGLSVLSARSFLSFILSGIRIFGIFAKDVQPRYGECRRSVKAAHRQTTIYLP